MQGTGLAEPVVSVVVPVFRSGEQLRALHARLRPVLDAIDPAWELILVDDASGDGTFEYPTRVPRAV